MPLRLRPYVRDYSGYLESTPGPLLRREFPAAQVVVILEFGPPIAVYEPGSETRSSRYRGGFVAGVHDRFTLTEHQGLQRGMQLNLTPLGARRLFGLPLTELAGVVVGVEDLLAARADYRGPRALADHLAELGDWDARFDLLDALLDAHVHARDPRAETVRAGTRRIVASGGRADIRALADELGCSHRHLIALFRDQVGVTPKLLARIVRFENVLAHLREDTPASFAELAAACGYHDQSHLTRDVRQFAGVSPTRLPQLLQPFAD